MFTNYISIIIWVIFYFLIIKRLVSFFIYINFSLIGLDACYRMILIHINIISGTFIAILKIVSITISPIWAYIKSINFIRIHANLFNGFLHISKKLFIWKIFIKHKVS